MKLQNLLIVYKNYRQKKDASCFMKLEKAQKYISI